MKIRTLQSSDIPILKHYAEVSNFPYPDFDDPHIESFLVVVDHEDNPIMACAARRLIELYLFVDSEVSPVVKMGAIRLLHKAMSENLRALTYNQANVSVPPSIAVQFGRRLERSFGWAKSQFQNWYINF